MDEAKWDAKGLLRGDFCKKKNFFLLLLRSSSSSSFFLFGILTDQDQQDQQPPLGPRLSLVVVKTCPATGACPASRGIHQAQRGCLDLRSRTLRHQPEPWWTTAPTSPIDVPPAIRIRSRPEIGSMRFVDGMVIRRGRRTRFLKVEEAVFSLR